MKYGLHIAPRVRRGFALRTARHLLPAVVALSTLAGCSKDLTDTPAGDGLTTLQFEASVAPLGDETKAPITGTGFPDGTYEIGLLLLTGSLSPQNAESANMTARLTVSGASQLWEYRYAGSDTWTTEPPRIRPTAKAKINAYYPRTETSEKTYTYVPFDLTTDEQQQSQTDFLWFLSEEIAPTTAPTKVKLEFKHAYALLEFQIKKSGSPDAVITAVEVTNAEGKKWIANKGYVSVRGGNIASDNALELAPTYGPVKVITNATLATDSYATIRVMVPAFAGEYGDDEVYVQFYDNGAAKPQKFPIKKAYLKSDTSVKNYYYLESGTKRTFKLLYDNVGHGSVTILDWDGDYAVTEDLGEGDYTDAKNGWFRMALQNNRTDAIKWDVAMGGTITPDTSPGTGTGTDGSICPAGYRMPTLSEMMLSWIYKAAMPGDSFYPSGYWSSESSSNGTQAWYVSHNGGKTDWVSTSSFAAYVRCLRTETATGVKVYPYTEKTGSGNYVIVSRDADGGVRETALLDTEDSQYINSKRYYNDRYNYSSDVKPDMLHNKVSPKFEIAAADITPAMDWHTAGGYAGDHAALPTGTGTDGSICPAGWRLPTQRELQLIWAMQSTGKITENKLLATYYWTGTVYDNFVWYVRMTTGLTDNGDRASTYNVRCVRDVDDVPGSLTDGGNAPFQPATKDLTYPNGATQLTWLKAMERATVDAAGTGTGTDGSACPEGYRMPKQTELMMMWIYKDAMPGKSFLSDANGYWSSKLQDSGTNPCYASMGNGLVYSTTDFSNASKRIRCVWGGVTPSDTYPKVTDTWTIVSRDVNGGIKTAALLDDAGIRFLNSKHPKLDETSVYNKVSPKFRVAEADTKSAANNEAMSWVAASGRSTFAGTPAGTGTDGSICPAGWRLPTQRELQLIWTMMSKLPSSGALDITGLASYWSGNIDSQYASDSNPLAWNVNVANGKTVTNSCSLLALRVRCVQDVK